MKSLLANAGYRWMFRYALAGALCVVIGYSAWRVGRHWQASSAEAGLQPALDRGDYPEARRLGRLLVERRPDYPEGFLLLARVERLAGDLETAAEHLRTSAQLGGLREAVELEYTLLATQRGDLSRERVLQAYVDHHHPQSAWILYALGVGYLQNYHLPQAEQAFEGVLQHKPEHVPALLALARARNHMLAQPEAAAAYRQALEIDPVHQEARLGLAEALLALGRAEEAAPHYEWLRERGQAHAPALTGLAKTYLQLERVEEARACADQALGHAAKGDQAAEAHLVRGKIEWQLDRPDEAEPWLRGAVAHKPEDRHAVNLLAQCLRRLDKNDEAERWQKHFERLNAWHERLSKACAQVRVTPRDPEPRLQAGRVFFEMGNEREGLRWLDSALREDPRHVASHRLLAEHYRNKGDQSKAAEHDKAASALP
jgi:tetratricopeptide (TPR) repeat protein